MEGFIKIELTGGAARRERQRQPQPTPRNRITLPRLSRKAAERMQRAHAVRLAAKLAI